MGILIIPDNVYFGAQTQRALENFQISGLKFQRELIWAQGIIKAASAKVNVMLGNLEAEIGEAIIQAAEEVIEGKHDQHFVVDVFQAGAGTSQNNNANEVIAKRAMELSGYNLKIHPNDHVNMSQSTNDTFPSALNLAATKMLNEKLLPALQGTINTLNSKATQFMGVLKRAERIYMTAYPCGLGKSLRAMPIL